MKVLDRAGTPLPARMMLTVLSLALLSACGGGGGGGGARDTLPVTPPPAAVPPQASMPPDFINADGTRPTRDPATVTGAGVAVGVLDIGFDDAPNFAHRAAVASQLQARLRPEDATAGTHGARVSRLIGGRNVGDAFPTGPASDFLLYQSNLAEIVTADKLSGNLKGLAARGAKIVNNSWSISASDANLLQGGSNVSPDSALVQAFFQPLREAVLEDGQLMIWANGNEGKSQPYLLAGAPHVEPALERGWLTVVELENHDLASSSNACGLAANWCLGADVAPGLSGTSFAAPRVTAVVAQLAQVFPWMDHSALRQTVLSTADDLGSRERTGWGELNAARALGGPARFDRRLTLGGDFEAAFDGQVSHFLNDIAGDAGLHKSGSGTLALWGQNTYTGTTRVDGGTLALHGALAAPVAVAAGALFAGEGAQVGGNVSNAGTVQVNTGSLHVAGDYVATSSEAVLAARLGSALTVGGRAQLNHSRLVALKPDDAYVVKSVENVVSATAVEGVFGQVGGDAGLLYTVTPRYGADRVDLEVSRRDVGVVAQEQYAGQTARVAAAQAVETGFRAADQAVAGQAGQVADSHAASTASTAFLAAAAQIQSIGSTAELASTLDSLSGQIHASSQALTFQQAGIVNRTLSDRIDALALPGQSDGLWATASGARGKLAQRGFATGTTHHYGGVLGFDRRLSSIGVIGAALSFGQADARFDAHGGRARNQTAGLSIFGRLGGALGAYLSGRLGYALTDADIERDVLLGDTRHRVKTSHTDGMASAYAEAGYTWEQAAARVTPFVGVSYDRLRRGAIDERGHALALTAGHGTYHQAAALLGARVASAPLDWAGGVSQLGAHAAYRRGERTDLALQASFVGAPDQRFAVKGIGLPRHTGMAGVSLNTRTGDQWSWQTRYDVLLGQGGTMQHAFSAGVRYVFD